MALRIYLEKVVGENCASIDDGDKVLQLVRPELVKGFQVEMDFKGVNLMLTPFLNACFGKLLEQFGREVTMTHVSMKNISDEFLQRINSFINRKEDEFTQNHDRDMLQEMFDEDGSKIVPENYRLKVYVSKINETYQYNYGDILGDITKIKDIMNMYKCDKCKKITNINNSVETINIEGKDYIKDGKYYSQILCDSCKNELKNVKWTEHIGKEIIKEVRKDDIVEQIFSIKTNTAIIDNPQNYTIKKNNDKFNIEVPNIKMSLSSPTNDTNYYLLSCIFNYNNHINTFNII
jgi:hypothetical protein